jgi:hypothetical protein
MEFVNCEIIGAGLTTYGRPVHRSTARNVRLENCRVNSFFGLGAVFDDVVVDGLRTTRAPVILSGCALRHVILRGDCGQFVFNRYVTHGDETRNSAFDAANAEFYKTVDWALDITQTKATCINIRGAIPARLICRNPDEHFIMSRAVAQSDEWKRFDPPGAVQVAVSLFLDSGADDNVFVAARRSKSFREDVEFFCRLKAAALVS